MNKRLPILMLFGLVLLLTCLPAIAQIRRSYRGALDGQRWRRAQDYRGSRRGYGGFYGEPGTGILGSSIYTGGPPHGTQRSSPGRGGIQNPSGRSAMMAPSMRQTRVYTPMTPLTVTSASGGPTALAVSQSLLADSQIIAATTALAEGAQQPITVTRPPVTSLAPPEPGAYRTAMLKAETALKQKDYAVAIDSFQAAQRASDDAEETLLSLAHAQLAAADGSYAKAASYLGQAIHAFPALPLARVHPKDFYGDPAEYDRILTALTEHVRANADDAEAMFVLGYLHWRDHKSAEAMDLLGDALVSSKDDELGESIDLLLQGMGASSEAIMSAGPPMQEPVDYPWAGVRLALPTEARQDRLSHINRVMTADAGTADDPQRIALSVYPIAEGVELQAVMASVTKYMNDQLGITNVTPETDAVVPFLDSTAAVNVLSCDYSGKRIVGARVCFIRESPSSGGQRLAYVLTMAVLEERSDELLPALAAVARSIELTDFSQPIDLPISFVGPRIADPQLGYSLRQPAGWVGSFDHRGFSMGQFDFTKGGAISPRVEVVVLTIPADQTPESFGKQAIEAKVAEGYEMTVLSHGQAELAGLEGYEFAVAKRSGETKSIEIARFTLVPLDDDQQRLYALVVRCQGATEAQARTVLDAIASEFTLRPPDATE